MPGMGGRISSGSRATVLALAAVLLIACSSGSRSPSSTAGPPAGSAPSTAAVAAPPTPTARPGPPVVSGTAARASSPAAAVAGFLDQNSSFNYPAACTYVVPAEQANCPGLLANATLAAQGPVTLTATDVAGTQALVVVVGRVCADFTCYLNSNPRAGLPASPSAFPAAYQAAISQLGTGFPTLPCLQVNGNWYVELGPSAQ